MLEHFRKIHVSLTLLGIDPDLVQVQWKTRMCYLLISRLQEPL